MKNYRANAIVAVSENGAIGKDGELPWKLPVDMGYFRQITSGHPVITGRTSYESIPRAYRPLKDRTNIILSRNPLVIGDEVLLAEDRSPASEEGDPRILYPGTLVTRSLQEAFHLAETMPGAEEMFIIGGGKVYEEALPFCERVFLTQVHAVIDGDTFFPSLDSDEWKLMSQEAHGTDPKHHHAFTWEVYYRR